MINLLASHFKYQSMNCALVVTCEHAGNRVPVEYQQLFNELGEMLNSHEGWDPGAWEVARQVADAIENIQNLIK